MDALKSYHPVVGFSFFLLMIILSLASMQPVFQCISFVAAVGYGVAVSGPRSFVRGNWWVIVLIIVVMLFNSVFGGRGLTVLFSINLGFMQTPVTVESLVYGLIMGLMLANVILWFNVLGKVSSMQGFIELFTKLSPTAGMMIARITVFIPELLVQAKLVDRAQRTFSTPRAHEAGQYKTDQSGALQAEAMSTSATFVATDSAEGTSRRSRKRQLAYGGALSSHLMEWGMEKSLITAHSMVARGYGSRKRTSFRRTRLTIRDLVPLSITLALGLTSFICVIWAGMHYTYYPHLSPLTLWWGYLPFVLLCLVPLVLQLGEEYAWWRSK